VAEQKSGEQLRRARDALASAVADARARGQRPERPTASASADGTSSAGNDEPKDGVTSESEPASGGRRRAASRPGFPVQHRRDDPQPLGRARDGLLTAEGWTLAAATGSVFGRWAQIVGSDLAAHTSPESLSDGELTVAADSTAWATQVRLLAAQLVRRLNAELGDGTVVRVTVTGPVTSTRKPGEWRVRGGRGPRDTYG
jgi:predicted nucleic acid-binding Zn ribbon protein